VGGSAADTNEVLWPRGQGCHSFLKQLIGSLRGGSGAHRRLAARRGSLN